MSAQSLSNIFLSTNNFEKSIEETKLYTTFERAGFNFINEDLIKGSESENYFNKVDEQISLSTCSIHFIGDKKHEYINGIGINEYHFDKISKRISEDNTFKTFIWMPADYNYLNAEKEQVNFINKIQNNLSNNITLSRVPYYIQFVEDVRLVLEQNTAIVYPTEPADVFLIYSETDEVAANKIVSMLSGILKLVKLNIIQDSDVDYEEFAAQQISASKLCVIFYQSATQWALPFVQQIWKKIGGASSTTQILFIGDTESQTLEFSAPKVTTAAVQYDLIPLEIKVQFDKVNEQL